MLPINENSEKVRKELMLLASSNTLTASLAVIVNAIVITFVFWNITNRYILLLWLFSITFISLLRFTKSKNYIKNHNKLSIEKEEQSFNARTLLTALITIIGIIYILPFDKAFHLAFLTMIIAGITGATVMSLATHKKTVRNYLIILLVPFIFVLLKSGSELNIMIAILSALFLLVMILFSVRYHNNIVDVIISKYVIEQSENEKKASEEKFYSIFIEAPIGLFTYNKDLIIQQANQTFSSYLDVPVEKLINLDIKILDDQSIRSALDTALIGRKGYYEGKYTSTISKKTIWINMQSVPMYDTEHNIIGGLGMIEDITKRIQLEQEIRHHAFYDNLTGLANRLTFNERLNEQLSRISRKDLFSAILFIDIDYFKNINDTLGHQIGDELLKTFATRANNIVRKEDTVSRFGGDEFVILLSDLSSDENHAKEYSLKIANKLHHLIKEPIKVENNLINVTLSIGINIISFKEDNIHTVLKHADTAMYEAKASGRNTTCFYNDNMN